MTEPRPLTHSIRLEMGGSGFFWARADTIGMSDEDAVMFERGLATSQQAQHVYNASRAFAEKLMCTAPAGRC